MRTWVQPWLPRMLQKKHWLKRRQPLRWLPARRPRSVMRASTRRHVERTLESTQLVLQSRCAHRFYRPTRSSVATSMFPFFTMFNPCSL
jgi:hypothetical protein